MRTLPSRGMPPRGSVQDLIASEMVQRERRREIASQQYVARLLQAGLGISDKIFSVWTDLYSLEVFQDNYSPTTMALQKAVLEDLDKKKKKDIGTRDRMLGKVAKLEVKTDSIRSASKEEREAFREKLRRKRLQRNK